MSTTPTLLPCPFCGAGETMLHVNKGTWNGQRYGEPVSVEVRHWCEPEDGQPARMVARVGRDEASAIAAWNRRAALAAPADALAEPVATVDSWTNGSYSRNYKLTWHKDVPEGTKLHTAQQLQQAVARAVERCAAICEDLADRACAAQEGPADDTTNVMLRQAATLATVTPLVQQLVQALKEAKRFNDADYTALEAARAFLSGATKESTDA